jgi:hypothetical protein
MRPSILPVLALTMAALCPATFRTPNPAAGGLPGDVIYEATCNCKFNRNYPFAFGPRLGVAYQITPKTVFGAGAGVSYSTSPNNAFLSYSSLDFTTVGAPGYGQAATQLSQGNPYAPGNVFGNPTLSWPDFSPRYPNEVAPGVRPPQSPFVSLIAMLAGRRAFYSGASAFSGNLCRI